MPIGPEPTIWEWIAFGIGMLIALYAFAVLILDRLPEWVGSGLRHVLFRSVPWLLLQVARAVVWGLAYLGAASTWVLSGGRVPAFAELAGRAPARVNRFEERARAYVAPTPAVPPDEGNDSDVAAAGNESGNAIATGQSAGNEVLPGNGHTRAQAAVIARLYHSGTVYIPDGKGGFKRAGQVELIKLATGISPSGREDSDYAKLKAELDPMLRREPTINRRPAVAPAPATEELAEAR